MKAACVQERDAFNECRRGLERAVAVVSARASAAGARGKRGGQERRS